MVHLHVVLRLLVQLLLKTHGHGVLLFLLVDLVEALSTAGVVGVSLSRSLTIVKVEHVRVIRLIISLQALALLQLQITMASDSVNWIGCWVWHFDSLDLPHFFTVSDNRLVTTQVTALAQRSQ